MYGLGPYSQKWLRGIKGAAEALGILRNGQLTPVLSDLSSSEKKELEMLVKLIH